MSFGAQVRGLVKVVCVKEFAADARSARATTVIDLVEIDRQEPVQRIGMMMMPWALCRTSSLETPLGRTRWSSQSCVGPVRSIA